MTLTITFLDKHGHSLRTGMYPSLAALAARAGRDDLADAVSARCTAAGALIATLERTLGTPWSFDDLPAQLAAHSAAPPSVAPPSVAPPSVASPSAAPPSVAPPPVAPPSVAPLSAFAAARASGGTRT